MTTKEQFQEIIDKLLDKREWSDVEEFEHEAISQGFEGTETVVVQDNCSKWYLFPEDVENLDDESAKAFDFMVNSLT